MSSVNEEMYPEPEKSEEESAIGGGFEPSKGHHNAVPSGEGEGPSGKTTNENELDELHNMEHEGSKHC